MKITWTRVSALACAAAMVASSATAATVYVDATDGAGGNTAVAPSAGGGVFTPLAAQGPAGDGLWDVRAFSNNATIYQNAGTSGSPDDAQRLVTSATVPAGTYDVFAYFWSDSSNTWRMGASLVDEAGDLPVYDPASPGVVQFYDGVDATVLSSSLASNPFTSDVMVGEGNRRLYEVPLGQVTGTEIAVYIDDEPNQADQAQRTWYDGIGYRAVPEPASLALMCLSAFAAAARRRG
ncbi:hypothetical protein KOR34_30490 [Posidoniimonas corsicana]|uniref:Ice-binding protein C-terminal domain-containing protein n=1 Tax=Posidoniimonas corsicana TaxID=1938618 RepID=A0A5C5VJ06_9BACT|nr:PEP-CTERM sorting domain-containing protein [Posidoniimonas corsicana]TWT38081.1 hypothetical protein KOR34_30490 [Posidoniimonas corsicana]